MTALARGTGPSGAEAEISGTIPINAAWSEDIYFFDPATGAAMDLTGLDFYFQFRCSADQTTADITLSTNDSTLTIETDSGSVDSILRVNSPSGTFSRFCGDMIADLVAVDQSGDEFLYGHGIVSFRNNPVAI